MTLFYSALNPRKKPQDFSRKILFKNYLQKSHNTKRSNHLFWTPYQKINKSYNKKSKRVNRKTKKHKNNSKGQQSHKRNYTLYKKKRTNKRESLKRNLKINF